MLTCIEGDLKVSGVLKNGLDKPYLLVEDHEQDITEIIHIFIFTFLTFLTS